MIITLILALLQEYTYAYSPRFQILKNINMENTPILTLVGPFLMHIITHNVLKRKVDSFRPLQHCQKHTLYQKLLQVNVVEH